MDIKLEKSELSKNLNTDAITQIILLPHGKAQIECLKIWANRRPKYGDKWKDNKEYQLLALVIEKAQRLEHNFESGDENYENKKDTLIDLINWAMFYLQNLEDGKYENRNN